MIVVKISGGLGNQLFQYAFGQYAAEFLNTEVHYDIQTDKDIRNFTARSLHLTKLNLRFEYAKIEEINKIKHFTSGITERIERKIIKLFPFVNSNYIIEDINSNIKLKNNAYYDGYWQSFKYIPSQNRYFDNLNYNEFSTDFVNIIKQIEESESVSLHIRRGDYLSIKKNNNIFHICSVDYYNSAICLIKNRLNNSRFYIFSDDIEWAKENFNSEEYSFISGNEPIIDVYLMSLCKHNIIANSTFSWWGAWLNNNKNKLIVAPKLWFLGPNNNLTTNLIPPSWIRI